MSKSRITVVMIVTLALAVSACQGSSSETTTTLTSSSLVDLPEPAESTTTSTTTTLPIVELSAPEYQIVRRIPDDDGGDELVILLDPTSYESLSDIDIQDLFAEVVELFPPVWTAHLVDDPAAVAVVIDDDASTAQLAEIENNYLARLDKGFEITYLGPFAESGTGVLGS